MSTQTATIQLRIDANTKRKAQNVLKTLGTDLSSALKLFLSQVITTKSIPFIPRTGNGYTKAYERMILDHWHAMKKGDEKTAKSLAELMNDLYS